MDQSPLATTKPQRSVDHRYENILLLGIQRAPSPSESIGSSGYYSSLFGNGGGSNQTMNVAGGHGQSPAYCVGPQRNTSSPYGCGPISNPSQIGSLPFARAQSCEPISRIRSGSGSSVGMGFGYVNQEIIEAEKRKRQKQKLDLIKDQLECARNFRPLLSPRVHMSGTPLQPLKAHQLARGGDIPVIKWKQKGAKSNSKEACGSIGESQL